LSLNTRFPREKARQGFDNVGFIGEENGAEIQEAVVIPDRERFYVLDPFGNYFEFIEMRTSAGWLEKSGSPGTGKPIPGTSREFAGTCERWLKSQLGVGVPAGVGEPAGPPPSAAQPPLPLQEFLPLQPLSLVLQPP